MELDKTPGGVLLDAVKEMFPNGLEQRMIYILAAQYTVLVEIKELLERQL